MVKVTGALQIHAMRMEFFNYSHNIVKTGLLFKDFQDAVKEADGARVEYLWKFMMLLFKVAGKTKYALAAARLHYQLHSLLTP